MRASTTCLLVGVCIAGCGGEAGRRPSRPLVEPPRGDEQLVRTLFEPFTRAHPGDLVVASFDASEVDVVVVRGGPDAAELVYPLGSQSKLAVALGFLELEAEGLSRRASLSALDPSLLDAAGALTPEDLLTHHGGLPFEPPSWEGGPYDAEALSRDLAEHPPEPGQFRYSNFGFMVLAHVVERRIGRSFRDDVDRRLTRWMRGREGSLGFAVDGPRATLHDEDGRPPEEVEEPYLRWSCCLLRGDVRGLASLGRMLLEARAPHRDALEPVHERPDGRGSVGLGSFATVDGALVWSQGVMPGAYSVLALDPRHSRGVAVVSATNVAASGGLLQRALTLLRVRRGDTAPPTELAPIVEWSMRAPAEPDAWWSLRPESFAFEPRGVVTRSSHNATLWLRRPLPARGVIRARVRPLSDDIDVKLDLLAPALGLDAFGEDDVAGYRLVLGGWGNTRSVFSSAPDESHVVWERREQGAFVAGRAMEIEVTYDEETIRVSVDEDLVFRHERSRAGGARFLGVSGWSAPARLEALTVEAAPSGR